MNSHIQDHSCLTVNRSVQSPPTRRRAWLRLMQYGHRAIASLTVPVGLSLVLALVSPASAQQHYKRVNLVSDTDGVALRKDPNLVNPWGVAFSPTSPFWISDNGTGVSTLYDGAGKLRSLVVTIPPFSGSSSDTKATPTGQVFNGSSSFEIQKGSPSVFLFATEDGTISGWNPTVNRTQAILMVDHSNQGAVYKGLAIGISKKDGPSLYATNFHDGVVEQYKQESDLSLHLVRTFTDKDLNSTPCNSDPNSACFAPFGIQNINGLLYVTYAKQKLPDKHDDDGGPGKKNNGFVDIFDTDGNLVKRFASGGELNSPWGLALAPQNFGQFSGALLVGNFGDGHINAFDFRSGHSLGQLHDQIGQILTINGLWALVFGNGQQAGARDSLFFTAGIYDESHGLFGVIRASENQDENDEYQDENGKNQDVTNY